MSSIGPNRFAKSFKVAATVSAYRVVSFDTATSGPEAFVRVIQIPTETSFILGVSQDYADTTGAQFQATPVLSFGYGKVAAGTSVSSGALLTFVTTTGYAIESGYASSFNTGSTAFNTTGSKVPLLVGVALQKASLSDAVLECFINISNVRIRVN